MGSFRAGRVLCLFSAAVVMSAADGPVRFNRDIRPIMSNTCFACHGPDKSARMANLRLDIREEALKPNKAGIAPIIPGDPEKSAIVQRIFATGPRLMPPKFSHKELTAAQKETIRRWVAEGAQYEGHWAYQPVQRPAVPQVAASPQAPVRNPIDAFVRDTLAQAGLAPSPEADKRTLLRRVTFDLTGLPPTPEDLAAFLNDRSADAYERVVDRLLGSSAHAEMQTLRWLDAVRYADSAGFHGDNLWPAWPYRDYVLRAIRENKPFDQFTREQIAGDLLPDATLEHKIASAYNRLNRASAEGGLQPKEYLAKYGADRVRTLSTVWMGATMGCAECHDHRFDPFSAKDFYSMKAFFADIRETGLITDRGARAWGSKLMLPTEQQAEQMKKLTAEIDGIRKTIAEKIEAREEKRWEWEDRLLAAHQKGELAWKYQRPVAASASHGATLTIHDDDVMDINFYLNGSLASEKKRADGWVVASGANPDNEVYEVRIQPGAGTWTAIGIDILQDESLPGNRLARGADRFVLTEVEAELSNGTRLPFVLATTTGFGQAPENPAMAAIDGDAKSGWAVSYGEHRNAFIALRLARPLTTVAGSTITLRLRQESDFRRATIGRFRVALSAALHSYPETGDSGRKNRIALQTKTETATINIPTDLGVPPDVVQALQRDEEERNDAHKKLIADFYAWAEPDLQGDTVRLAQLEAERDMLETSIPRVMYTERMKPRITRVLHRGNFLDESGEIVEPAIPARFGRLDTNGRRANRLDLANWLVSKDNPLTARTQVNRMWRQFFGTGLSKVLEDLGSQGEWPTHPELVDWLAAEFMERWDSRHILRTIVTSHTYRQSSLSTPQLDDRDPDNRFLARQSRFRVDAEVVRDIALSVSGLLAEQFGGPSVKPVQPDGYFAAMNFPKREYSASRGNDLHRRSLYTLWQRTFLHPTLLTFDAPTREECAVNRVNSNTPLQALTLLNDPIFVEASRAFAQNILISGGTSFDARIEWAFQRALNRAPAPEEKKILETLYARNVKRGDEVSAMSEVARTILNLHETITRN
jgi:hypothetical protein